MKYLIPLTALALAVGAASARAASVNVVDLVNADSGTSNDVVYEFISPGSGSGVLEPFLRTQANGNASSNTRGYNGGFSASDAPWDSKTGTWTHSLQFTDLVYVERDGVGYFEFLLDINEKQSDPDNLLSLNSVKIFSSASSNDSGSEDLSTLGTLRFDMDVGSDGDTTVELDAGRSSGSGYADMVMYILASNFDGVSEGDYITFYTQFGDPNKEDGGFEEWSLRSGTQPPPPPVPLPGTLSLLGAGLLGLGLIRRKSKD